MKRSLPFFLTVGLLCSWFGGVARSASVWVEAESPAKANVEGGGGVWNRAELLSGGRSLNLIFEAGEVASRVPSGGIELSYNLEAPEAGEYELWNRVGFEGVRAPFSWRINGGEWQGNSHLTHPAIDLVETAFWNPLGWTLMGTAVLKAGVNTLEIKIEPQKNEKGEVQALRYVSDAICAFKGAWVPNHHHSPGSDWRTEEDQAAEGKVFAFPKEATGPREVLDLAGTWQFAAWDERGEITEESRVKGVEALPDLNGLHWRAIPVPGNRNKSLPDFVFNHRYLLRTRVEVPEAMKGRSFVLDLREINLMATLFVNGKKVGEQDIVYGFWSPDITRMIEPGKVNEIVLVFKDAFYAMRPDNEGRSMRLTGYLPMSMFESNQGTTMRFDYPVRGAEETGILAGAALVASAGPGYVRDTVITTSVAKRQLEARVTVANPTAGAVKAEVAARVEPVAGGEPLFSFPKAVVDVPAGGEQVVTLSMPWPEEGKLWWPDDPQLYWLKTDVEVGGKPSDARADRFGFREWEVRGNQFYLNGIRWQLRADLAHYDARAGSDLAAIRKDWEEKGMNMFRHRFQWNWGGMRTDEAIRWLDEVGMPTRLNVGSFDGQFASYGFGEVDKPNAKLLENWIRQMHNRVDRMRNSPAVFIWELDNEIIYINARNLGKLDIVEPAFTRAWQELSAKDPTRVAVIGGGNALRDQSLPTYGVHYFEVSDREYPHEAYTIEKSLATQNSGGGRNPWPMDFEKKPTFMSETAFLPGRSPAGFAAVGGEVAFLGKTEAKPAAGMIGRWLTEGYRWRGVAAFHHWFGPEFTGGRHYVSFQPVALFCRDWDSSFGSGAKVTRELKLLNESRWSDPIEAEWAVLVDGKQVAGEIKTYNVPPGGGEAFVVSFTMPEVSTRTGAELVLTAKQRGKEVFRDRRVWSVLPRSVPQLPEVKGDVLVWDPHGSVVKRLTEGKIAFKPVNSLAEVPESFGLLVVGKDAVSAGEATDGRWLALAAGGNKILVLDQAHPLHFQALPANVEPTGNTGRVAFIQEVGHPAFEGLQDSDFHVWPGNGVVYRNAYKKATTGARSLVHADDQLSCSVLAICPVNEGVIVVSQMALGDRLGEHVVADRLFDNLLRVTASHALPRRPTVVVADAASPTGKMLAGLGMTYEAAADPVAAIKGGKAEIVVVQATPENLAALAAQKDEVRAFCEKGGWIKLMGVTPEGLESFNRLVGYDHLLRPFRRERVLFAPSRDPLTAGLGLQDVVMSSGERIQVWNRDEWPVDDAFDYIVDLDDIAPFATFPGPEYWNDPETKGPGDDTWPLNMVNGYLADTHWRMIFSIHLNKGDPTKWTIELPREEEIIGFSIAPNGAYHEVTKLRLSFDEDPSSVQEFSLSGSERQDLEVQPVRARKVTIELAEWSPKGTVDVIGVDNLWIRVRRPDDFKERVRPMLNIGGLVRYPIGRGGIILNQYRISERETNPANAGKKQQVVATLLRNLGAPFVGGRTIVAGRNLTYYPVSLEAFSNLYLKSGQGFPVKERDLSALPVGERTFAGVRYEIRDFATSPLESGVMLKHGRYRIQNEKEAVENIPVGRKADALFFLHTLLPGDRWDARGDGEPPIVMHYVVHYEDGTEERVPVELGRSIAAWLQAEPKGLRDAMVAWQAAPEGGGEAAVVYQMQWTNPRPDKQIRAVSMRYGPDGERWGAPVLLAVTAAEAGTR